MSEIVYPAHIRSDGTIQAVQEHCKGVADIAGGLLSDVGLKSTAYLAGILHDMGKFTGRFFCYISDASAGKPVRKGSVNHTFAGVRYILNTAKREDDSWYLMTAEIVAYAIGAHHGLFDCVDENGKYGFAHRMDKEDIGYDEALEAYNKLCVSDDEIKALLRKAVDEIKRFFEPIYEVKASNDEITFYIGMSVRLILSAVIEGDRSDTAYFMTQIPIEKHTATKELWSKLASNVEQELEVLRKELYDSADKEINMARDIISNKCKEKGKCADKLFRLQVPTGGGKTISSLRFALANAIEYDKKRIIFVTPLLSILDQNVDVIRKFLRNDDIVLEHHSNVTIDIDSDEWSNRELLKDNWNAPIIVTTLVQLLNTLYDSKTSAIRRYNALCDSVIVIDEVQTVPTRMITLFNLAVNFLTEFCNTTMVLCSATQPCFEKTSHTFIKQPKNIIRYNRKLWRTFRRTKYINLGEMSLDEIAQLAIQTVQDTKSILIVCNKIAEAEELYKRISGLMDNTFYMSSSLCMEHRRDRLKDIRQSLCNDAYTICVSTQVIEAGVDISFSSVIRLTAGIDNIIQSAGRCNRNGESEEAMPVLIVSLKGERLTMLKDIERQKQAALDLFTEYKHNPDKYEHAIDSDEAVNYYYRSLYRNFSANHFDYVTDKNNSSSLYDFLSFNEKYVDEQSSNRDFVLTQAFKSAGDIFCVIDNSTMDVIVPYGKGKYLMDELCTDKAGFDILYRRELIRKAKPYTVSLYGNQIKQLKESGGIISVGDDCVIILNNRYYDDDIGLNTEGKGSIYLEV